MNSFKNFDFFFFFSIIYYNIIVIWVMKNYSEYIAYDN
jgi:hypothetical protein